MGKKVKKDDKGPPDDVFGTLLVESRQAATVVLMLQSPEEDILSKACEAIYKFVDKCEENKKLLLDLDAVDALLKLIQHEDRIVRRNACMAIGVLAEHADVRKALRKREDAIPSFIRLLSPDEDTAVHEFIGLALCSMAQDYRSKVAICERNGMEPLIQCLSSNDPDVQKNSIETISLLLQDYQCRTSLRMLNGFLPILDLVSSEFPVIQHLALVALHRATEDPENRAVLRDLEGVNSMIDFIGRPDFSDLHTFAVIVLSNCLEDTATMEQIRENGGLSKLVAFITDKPPPEEEENKGKGKGKGAEKGAAKAGKKGKDDAKKKGKEKKDKKGKEAEKPADGKTAVDPVIPTLPEVKEYTARAIARAAKNAENRKILHEQEVGKMLITLLSHENQKVQIASAQAIGVMAESLSCRESVGQWDGIEPLVKMVKSDNPDVREAASMALANVTTGSVGNCNEVVRYHGIDPVVSMLSDPRELAVANAAIILTNIAPDEHFRLLAQNAGVIKALIYPLQSNNSFVLSKVALAIGSYVCDAEARADFRERNGVEPLVNLLYSMSDDVRRSVSWAITVCAIDEPTAIEVSKHGGLEILQEIQLSSTRKNAFTDVAIQKLLDSNLSAKYALTNQLDQENLIADGFFDMGSMRAGAKFLTLEDYCKQELNDKRPIILVNAKPEKPQTPAPPVSEPEITTEKSSKTSGTGRTSRTGKDKKKKERERERERLEKEELQNKEVIDTSQVEDQGPTGPPGDSVLVKYLEEVVDKIAPLPSTKDQTIALAQFVSDKMGGPIDRGQLSYFSWELPLSQLKYEMKSNVIPIGMIKTGIHYHRALLFKALADRIALGCTLVRGQYNKAWNVILMSVDDDAPGAPQFPPKAYIVDLVYYPGSLMLADSPAAIQYQKI